ncbi:type II toxin-antitoxin system ParD family antitoxin [Marinobacterium sp. D7]|uniref:type II toxin-antitoxin system ParD family antitoxin n=1 Tax=Marinobacterium ramblicola TaxID=2849041 RepID=UPI001C2D3354|nr:type II toxin-antitoxin system ParD family antitoxin [Marinobacterium ramblicola]MBV1790195.1 type II toxin-antitoxin system ParD family antitoxin [Marinobacterium ramblicola]
MATMNISLPNEMKCWVEEQTLTGRYSNSSDYVRDLIRRDQDRSSKVAQLQLLITEGLESGVGEQSMSDLKEQALRLLAKGQGQ